MKEMRLSRLKYSLLKIYKSKEYGSEIECIAGDMQQHLNKGES